MAAQPATPAHYCPACRTTTPAPHATAEALVQAGVDHRAVCAGPADLRQRIADAIRTAPASGWTHKPGEERFDHHTDGGHNYSITCGLCRNDVESLADAVLATVQPELDQLRAQVAAWRGHSLAEAAKGCPVGGGCDWWPVESLDEHLARAHTKAQLVEAACDLHDALVTATGPGQRPGCPDPIECDHEAELEQLRAELADRVNLREARMTLQAFRHAINGTANQITDLVRDIGRANGPVARARRESAHYRRRWESTVVEARRQAARADAAEVELDRTRAELAAVRAELAAAAEPAVIVPPASFLIKVMANVPDAPPPDLA